MKSLPSLLLAMLMLLASFPGETQQTAKPILSAEPAPPAAAPPIQPASGTADANYIIGADDSLKIDVWNEPRLSAILPVRPDGMITISDIGDIMAEGRTPMQLAADITAKVKKIVLEPTVNVSVLAVNSKRVFMLGEVAHVGPLSITPGMTVLQAIASAGGLTPYAKKRIYILRGTPPNQTKVSFDYTKAVKKGDMQGVSLVPGDTIVVP